MIKKSYFLIFLLFIISAFISCSNSRTYFEKGDYKKVVEILDEKKVLSKEDHLLRIKSLYNLGKTEEAKENIMLYLLMCNNEDERSLPVQLFLDLGYSDTLNILILKTSDGIKAQTTLFKSYFNLNQFDKALNILNEYLASNLSLVQYLDILIEYPCDNSYTTELLYSWCEIITDDELFDYLTLFERFINLNLNDDIALKCFNTISMLENNNSISDTILLAKINEIKGDLCYKLHDLYNGNLYYQRSLKLNPKNNSVLNKIK